MSEIIQYLIRLITTKTIASLVIAGAVLSTTVYYSNNDSTILDHEETEDTLQEKDARLSLNDRHQKIMVNTFNGRQPASLKQSKNFSQRNNNETAPEITEKNEDNYNSVSNALTSTATAIDNNSNNVFYPPLSFPTTGFSSLALNNNDQTKTKPSSLGGTTSQSEVFLGAPIKKTIMSSLVPSDESNSNNSPVIGNNVNPLSNTCSTDIVSGTFGNPIGINISCTYQSDIKYCLGKNTCCDPLISGTTYTGTITVGADNGNYCLSFYGDSNTHGDSEVSQSNYIVNNTYPHLMVGTPKTYFQTTELTTEVFITSNDFGKSQHFAGQINFKTNDPTASGLNYSCQDIAENDHLTLNPIPSTTLAILNIDSLLPTNEIKIPFKEDKLSYGINYISSYIKNDSFITPLYSCSTNQIVLEDFDFFESAITQSVPGDNETREFEGQFSAFGFFEEDTQVFRGPAGASSNEKSGSTLESGLLSVFY